MRRRTFLLTGAASTGASLGLGVRLSHADQPLHRRQLSERGCGRATGYAETNKILTLGDRTHVAWLDSVEAGFRVRIRTLDRRSGQWSPVYTVGEAFDNHGGPALTADSRGHLHIVYYPHHHPFRYRRSLRPNDASEWSEDIELGRRCTYPTLLCGPDDTFYLTARQSDSGPWRVNLYRKPVDGSWGEPTPILRSLHPGYAHFQEALAWGPDHRTLHLSCRIHEREHGKDETIGYMLSRDFGRTWQRLDGTRIDTPATSGTVDAIARGGREPGKPTLRCGAIAVDADDRPHVLYSAIEQGRAEFYLATPDGSGGWRRRSLRPHLPEDQRDAGLAMPGGVTFTENGRLILLATLHRLDDPTNNSSWGHPSSEIVRFTSTDAGRTFEPMLVSRPDPDQPHWLPNLERPTGHHAVPDRPSVIYTAGPRGENNKQILANGVIWVR